MKTGPKEIPTFVKDARLIEMRRRQIVEAAVQLFIRKGFHKTTTREIAQASGFSIGTLYEYIESKEDILYLVCDAIHSQIEARLQEVVAGAGSGYAILVRAFEGLIRVMDEMDDQVLLIYQEAKSLPRDTLGLVLKKEEEITEIFAGLLRRGIGDGSIRLDPDSVFLTAHNLVVLAEMWAFRRWALRRHYTLEEYVAKQIRVLLPIKGEGETQAERRAGQSG